MIGRADGPPPGWGARCGIALLAIVFAAACGMSERRDSARADNVMVERAAVLESRIREVLSDRTAEVGVSVIQPATGLRVGVGDTIEMHAASTMKVPVMLELFRQAETGSLSLDDSLPVTTRFRSIAADTTYELTPESDSDSTLYARVGERVPIRDLVRLMIVRSSNLALNLLIDRVSADSVRRTLAGIGASEMVVRRGVEDIPAFEAGLNNTTTARGFAAVLEAIEECTVNGRAACDEMITILSDQEFNEMIPRGLPPGTRVAHKTGWITGIRHDGGIVLADGTPPWVLVILTRGIEDPSEADALGAEISRTVWQVLSGGGTDAR